MLPDNSEPAVTNTEYVQNMQRNKDESKFLGMSYITRDESTEHNAVLIDGANIENRKPRQRLTRTITNDIFS